MNVIESNKKILRKYPDYNTLFFIDSDFDEKVELPNLYVTCGYSIENFYCSSEVISEILKNEFFLNVTDREYIILMNLFEKLQKEFHKSSELFNLWYFTIKNKAKQLGISCGASLNDKFPKGFLSISLDRVNSTYDLEIIKSKFPNAIDVTQEDLNQNKSLFFTKSPWLLFRGKYEIEFIIKFLNLIIDDANTTKKYLKNKSQFRVDSTLILSQLSQYAITTFELKDFLNSKLN